MEHTLSSAADWNRTEWGALWLYNLHYFDDLVAVDAHSRMEWHRDLIGRWIRENPPREGVGWDSYPLSLRTVNWIKWLLCNNEASPEILGSLAVQLRYLSRRVEWHLLGNHVLANAKALVFGGLFFGGPEADTWLTQGRKILAEQIPEQVLRDGGHFERSAMYHSIILEDLLDLMHVFGLYDQGHLFLWRDHAKKMLSWLAHMIHPDGDIVLFNDAANGIAARQFELLDYAERLGLSAAPVQATPLVSLPQTGYVKATAGTASLFVDAAPVGPEYQAAHAHADTLTFELSIGPDRLIVDTGTYCYDASPEDRAHDRSTQAHNTVVVDGQNSSEVWSSFRVARRARVSGFTAEMRDGQPWVQASHDGYCRLTGVGLLTRNWRLGDSSLELVDAIEGKGAHNLELRFHLHPDIEVSDFSGDNIQLHSARSKLNARLSLDRRLEVSIQDYSWHPEFGTSLPGKLVLGRWRGQLPVSFSTRIEWY